MALSHGSRPLCLDWLQPFPHFYPSSEQPSSEQPWKRRFNYLLAIGKGRNPGKVLCTPPGFNGLKGDDFSALVLRPGDLHYQSFVGYRIKCLKSLMACIALKLLSHLSVQSKLSWLDSPAWMSLEGM